MGMRQYFHIGMYNKNSVTMTTDIRNITFNSKSKTYTNYSVKNILEYVTTNSIVLDLPFIMTCDKR